MQTCLNRGRDGGLTIIADEGEPDEAVEQQQDLKYCTQRAVAIIVYGRPVDL